jgi:hypothetical protein
VGYVEGQNVQIEISFEQKPETIDWRPLLPISFAGRSPLVALLLR